MTKTKLRPKPKHLQILFKQLKYKQGGKGIYIAPPMLSRDLREGKLDYDLENRPIRNQNSETYNVIKCFLNFFSNCGKHWEYLQEKGYQPIYDKKGQGGIQISPQQLEKLTLETSENGINFRMVSEVYGGMNRYGRSGEEELREIVEIEKLGVDNGFKHFKPKPKWSVESEIWAEVFRQSAKD